MLGKKDYQEKLFLSFHLSERVPEDNFYRRLKDALDLHFLYKLCSPYYGREGQQSIDPTVFFKIMLVGYLENIVYDRALIEHIGLRLDLLYFLGYDIDEPLPWHSTISRTRKLLPSEILEEAFNKVLQLCIGKGMVSGRSQAIDSALIKANASMESLEMKVPEGSLSDYIQSLEMQDTPRRKAKSDKSSHEQRTLSVSKTTIQSLQAHQRRVNSKPRKSGHKRDKAVFYSNKTHYSPTDPDARIATKPQKTRKLNYLSQLGVDLSHHVITHISADYADKKDNQCLQAVVEKLSLRMQKQGLLWENILADAGYSSGENYAYLEEKKLISYIPPHGTYKGGPEGFIYIKEGNYWLCPQGKNVTYRKTKSQRGTQQDFYYTRRSDCKSCPKKTKCIGKSTEKRISITSYKSQYDRAIKRSHSKLGRHFRAKRMGTVEPVFGSLINYFGMSKINARGIEQAHKIMLMAAMSYNLKKYMKFNKNKRNDKIQAMRQSADTLKNEILSFIDYLKMQLTYKELQINILTL